MEVLVVAQVLDSPVLGKCNRMDLNDQHWSIRCNIGYATGRDSPISARRRALSSTHRSIGSFPTTLSTNAASIPSCVSSSCPPVFVARFFTHPGSGHETASSVPSDIANVQHA